MSKLFHVVASSARQTSRHDRASSLKGTLLITLSAVLLSLVLTSIAILVVGERDWLSALVLATLLPLLLLPPPLYLVGSRLMSLDRQNHQLQQLAREDHLTGLFNRPHLLSMLERELALSQRHNYTVSILLLEINDFTQLLDEYGRHTGEKALRLFADCIREKIRESDLFGYDDAARMGEGLRALTAGIRLTSQQPGDTQQENVKISAKIGVASTENSGRSINPLLNEADYALYQNRNEGRDRSDPQRNNL